MRLALPVPARDGEVVVDGWAATRFEPGTTPCQQPRDPEGDRPPPARPPGERRARATRRPRRADRPLGRGRASGVRRPRRRRERRGPPRAGARRSRRRARDRAGRHRPGPRADGPRRPCRQRPARRLRRPRSSSTSPPPGAHRCGPRRSASSTPCCGSTLRSRRWTTGAPASSDRRCCGPPCSGCSPTSRATSPATRPSAWPEPRDWGSLARLSPVTAARPLTAARRAPARARRSPARARRRRSRSSTPTAGAARSPSRSR